jgi:chromosomal replication initiator protein
MHELWLSALPLLRQRVGERNFITWIEPIHCGGEDGGVRLEVPSRFFQQWITRHFLLIIRDTLASLAGKPCEVKAVVNPRDEQKRRAAEVTASRRSVQRMPSPAARGPKVGRLVERYTFDSFVVGASNVVAFNAAQEVSLAPGRRFNPVVVHGGVGLGKTHLINAIGHALLSNHRGIRVACLSAESFINLLISSLRHDQMVSFRDRFRAVDALILDDVQFLAGKERTQEEFFHTFNTLYENGKQIVLTTDKAPAAIPGLEQRLRSRFEGGLIADIQPPTWDMRLAIVLAKAAAQQIELPVEVAELLVKRAGPSVRELEGALTRVAAAALVARGSITLELAQETLRSFAPTVRRLSVETVQETVAQRFGVNAADLISHRRDRQLALPRQIAMFLSRTVADATFPSIGEKFGGRDHSTVVHAVRVIEERRAADSTVDSLVEALESQLQAGEPFPPQGKKRPSRRPLRRAQGRGSATPKATGSG